MAMANISCDSISDSEFTSALASVNDNKDTSPGVTRALVWGHSFVRRLNDYIFTIMPTGDVHITKDFNLNIEVDIEFQGGGLAVEYVKRAKEKFDIFKPELLILHVGGNDLTKQFQSPLVVASAVDEICEFALDCGCLAVVILPIMYRVKGGVRGVADPVATYNRRVDETNHYIEEFIGHRSRVMLWTYTKQLLSGDPLGWDGVHLKLQRLRVYYDNVRGALIKGQKLIAGESKVGWKEILVMVYFID